MAIVHQQVIKSTSAFSQILKGAIKSRMSSEQKSADTPVLPQASRPAYVTPGIAPDIEVPALVARVPEQARTLAPFLVVPAVTSPLTSVDAVVRAARSKALLQAYEREIESYPDIPLF